MRTERGFARLVSFSDGVVAIAITLLVLPLVSAAAEESGDIVAFLQDNTWQLFVFVLSFVVIGRFWMVHHDMYERIVGYTPGLMWANMLWLASIVFLPFPTQLLGSVDQESRITYLLYIGTMIVTCLAALLQQWIAVRNPSIQAEEAKGTLGLTGSVSILAVFVTALVIALVFPAIGLWSLLLVAVSGVLERIMNTARKRRNRAEASNPTSKGTDQS